MIHWWRKKRLLSKWRKRKRRKRTIRLEVRNVAGLFEAFDRQGIVYVVLRGFDEVPLTASQENGYDDDIDLLVAGGQVERIADIVCRQPGKIKCDLYGSTGRRGTSYHGMPYYPPVLAELILADRRRYKSGFYVPAPLTAFRAMLYHLVYHKGLDAGIDSGCHLSSNPNPKRPYRQLVEDMGQSVGADIVRPYTLASMHEYLQQCDWDMPFDLLERWPVQTDWHKYLRHQCKAALQNWVDKLPHLLVFFVREDAIKHGQQQAILDMLREKFSVLKMEDLTEQQIHSVIRKVRGGTWIEHKGTTLIMPKIAAICYDFAPAPVDESDVEKIKNYPLVQNRNVFQKHGIRSYLNNEVEAHPKIIGIHGSDNAYEAQHMLGAIYGDEVDRINNEILEKVSLRRREIEVSAEV